MSTQKPISAEWRGRIARAQDTKTYRIDGQDLARVPWGSEPPIPDLPVDQADALCGDCGVMRGQLHVPTCDMERCPACGEQYISCPHGLR